MMLSIKMLRNTILVKMHIVSVIDGRMGIPTFSILHLGQYTILVQNLSFFHLVVLYREETLSAFGLQIFEFFFCYKL
jgi:hypothetical protein